MGSFNSGQHLSQLMGGKPVDPHKVQRITTIITNAMEKSGEVFTYAELLTALDTLKQIATDIAQKDAT